MPRSAKEAFMGGTTILRLGEVKRRTGLSTSDIYRGQTARTFPQRVALGARGVGWLEHEVDAWIEQKIAAARRPGAPKNPPVPRRGERARKRPGESVTSPV